MQAALTSRQADPRQTPALSAPPEWPVYDAAAIDRCASLVAAGRSFDYRRGEEITELETLFTSYYARTYALNFNSGTSALFAAYYALGLNPGDEVLAPAYTFLATVSPLFLVGAIPVLCDSGGENGNVTVATLERRLTTRTRAIVITHLWGHPCQMDEIVAFAHVHGLKLIEDCSHAHGATYHGRKVGTFGDAAIFSIGAHKTVSGGNGGILMTDASEVYQRACLLGHFQQRSRLSVTFGPNAAFTDIGLGGNLRISPLAAALASSHMRRLDELIATKTRNLRRVLDAICDGDGIRAVPVERGCTMGGWYGCVVRLDERALGFSRAGLMAALSRAGVPGGVPSTAPLHRTSIFRGEIPSPWSLYADPIMRSRMNCTSESFAMAETLFDQWVSLPANLFHDEGGVFVEPYADAFIDAVRSMRRNGWTRAQ
ncbi:MAG TPA: DegT/DnrJ/EryC1/StrS family aminotransferase [Gemmatimonadaceae bacterium]